MPEAQLKRELGLRDITLFTITCIVGTRWIAAAAHAGPGSITLWILAAVFFAAPLAIAVTALTVRHPKAGGLYVWTREDFGPWHGFLCFWMYWMGIAIWYPSVAMFYMGSALHALALPDSRSYLLTASLTAIWIALGTNLVGMKIGKWTENIGGLAVWLAGVLFVVIAGLLWVKRGSATPLNPLPQWNWDTVNFWATIAYGMSGLEVLGLMGGEIRDAKRTIPRAGWIASAVLAAFYILGTGALLVMLPPSQISEMGGLAQAGDEAAKVLERPWLSPAIAMLVVASGLGQLGGLGASVSRLPYAASADRLLPQIFSRVHPRWGTPYASILAFGLVSTLLLIGIQLGDTVRAAYQTLVSLMVITGFLPYVYIFGSGWKSGHRISAISGWAITALAIVCAVVPTAEITNVALFEGKLVLGTAATVGSAWLVFRRRRA